MNLAKNTHQVTQWVNDYSDMLFAYAHQRVKDRDAAKDIVQETFLAAWRNVDNYKGEASEKNWLFVILKHKLIDHYRKQSSHATEALQSTAGNDNLHFDEAQHWRQGAYPSAWQNTPEQSLISKAFQEVLAACTAKLKAIQNTVFTMKYLDGMESEEICKVLELSSSNYWVLVHRAKLQLRACLERNWNNQ